MPRRVYPNLTAYFKGNPGESAFEIAHELGISPAFLSMIKWGERQPGLALALRMAERFQVPLESLLRKPTRKVS